MHKQSTLSQTEQQLDEVAEQKLSVEQQKVEVETKLNAELKAKADEEARLKAEVNKLQAQLQAKKKAKAQVNLAVAKKPAKPTPKPAGKRDCAAAKALIDQYDWNKQVAYNVMVVESGCNPMAANMKDHHKSIGCTGSFGLFQINCGHGRLYDPAANVAQAYKMWKASGWKPWSFTTCKKIACY